MADPWVAGTHELADVHAHFFNMSDIPMEGFIAHVLVPNRAPDLIKAADALRDIARWLKARSPTVRKERRGLHFALEGVPEHDVSAAAFSRAVADRINANAAIAPALMPGRAPLAPSAPSLAASYRELADVLNGRAGPESPLLDLRVRHVAPERIEAILREVDEPSQNLSAILPTEPHDPCAVVHAKCVEEACDEPEAPPLPVQINRILTALKWVWDMMQGRCNHVREYLRLTRGGTDQQGGWRPKLVVHHLVDYDRWLDDHPAVGSSHEEQIAFWTDYAQSRHDEIQILTFGGYDPLKHAEQRLLGEPLLFDRLKACYEAGAAGAPGPQIAGFKIYPPMGFKPSGNRAEDYRGDERARGIVSSRWRDNSHLAGHDVGTEINASLAEFYDFCLAHDAPILSHSIPGNQAACCFGQRANPAHWADLIDRDPRYGRLRLCLGHGISEADCFVRTVEAWQHGGSQQAPAHVWALHGTARLLQMSRAGQANIYADIGYLSELLKQNQGEAEEFAVRFFGALKWYCEHYDPECRRILFGTDWIMIGLELGYRRYVDLALHGMARARWPQAWQHNLLHANARDFLKLPAV